MRARRGLAPLAAGLVLAGAGCGGGGAPAATSTATPARQEQRGRELFVRTCGACHALAAAGTTGSVGPRLDDRPRNETVVREVIADGPGLMPAGLLTGRDASVVAAYVAWASRR